jgi:isoquinoline 1-oxidoreductase beta subunit
MTASTRREFLKAGAVAGGTMLLGFHLPLAARTNSGGGDSFAPNAFIRIDTHGTVTLIIPQVEMGQGIYTGLSMILAEELDASWDKVRVEHAPPNEKLYANPIFFIQATGGSTSVRAFWKPLRIAGASARALLVAAAAKRWGVGTEACRTANGTVTHQPSGRSLMPPWWRKRADSSRRQARRRSRINTTSYSSASR